MMGEKRWLMRDDWSVTKMMVEENVWLLGRGDTVNRLGSVCRHRLTKRGRSRLDEGARLLAAGGSSSPKSSLSVLSRAVFSGKPKATQQSGRRGR